jgi:uncharacterized SAM-binding protein YcdF (DUF218 family)
LYFIASKLLWLIFSPSNFLLLVAATGLGFLFVRRLGVARVLLTIGICGLLAASILPIGDRLAQVLEGQFPAWKEDGRPVDGIVVLGGSVNVWSSAEWQSLALNSAGNRLVAMADLARRFPNAKIVFTGGYGSMFGEALSEADIIEQHISELGIESGRVIFERASRNTQENAEFTRSMLEMTPHERWLLVTSAWHMPRSMGLFRKAGWAIEAYPVGWTSAPKFASSGFSTEASSHLLKFDLMVREWIGLIAAWALGQSDDLLPKP